MRLMVLKPTVRLPVLEIALRLVVVPLVLAVLLVMLSLPLVRMRPPLLTVLLMTGLSLRVTRALAFGAIVC